MSSLSHFYFGEKEFFCPPHKISKNTTSNQTESGTILEWNNVGGSQ